MYTQVNIGLKRQICYELWEETGGDRRRQEETGGDRRIDECMRIVGNRGRRAVRRWGQQLKRLVQESRLMDQ